MRRRDRRWRAEGLDKPRNSGSGRDRADLLGPCRCRDLKWRSPAKQIIHPLLSGQASNRFRRGYFFSNLTTSLNINYKYNNA